MQVALRPYVSASVAVIGAGLIAIMPVVVTPDPAQRAVKLASVDVLGDLQAMISTLSSDLESAFSQDGQAVGVILAELIDPGLFAGPGQALSELNAGFFPELNDAEIAGSQARDTFTQAQAAIADNNWSDVVSDDATLATQAAAAAGDLDVAQADATQVAAALSAADPIQVFEADLQADFSDLLNGQALSATTIADLVATLNAAPAAAQEAIALILDPAAAPAATGLVTALADANLAAEAAASAAHDYGAAASAANAAASVTLGAVPTAAQITFIANENGEVGIGLANASTPLGDSAVDGSDALNALDAVNQGDVSSEFDALGSDVLTQLDALGSTLWADLQTLGTDILSLF